MVHMAKADSADNPYRRFEELAKRLLQVDKKEVDQKEKERPKRERKKTS